MRKIELPKTKLHFEDGVLSKYGNGDVVMGSFPLSEIMSVRVEEHREYGVTLFLGGIFLSLAVVSKLFIASEFWSWSVAVVCLALVLYSLSLIKCMKIIIQTSKGKVTYPVMDPTDEALGFVVSLKFLLDGRR